MLSLLVRSTCSPPPSATIVFFLLLQHCHNTPIWCVCCGFFFVCLQAATTTARPKLAAAKNQHMCWTGGVPRKPLQQQHVGQANGRTRQAAWWRGSKRAGKGMHRAISSWPLTFSTTTWLHHHHRHQEGDDRPVEEKKGRQWCVKR